MNIKFSRANLRTLRNGLASGMQWELSYARALDKSDPKRATKARKAADEMARLRNALIEVLKSNP